MAVRNLTVKFLEIRSGTKANRSLRGSDKDEEGDKELLGSGQANSTSNYSKMSQSLPPAWVDKIGDIDDYIAKIQSKSKELTALHTKRLMINFDSDEAQQEREIERMTQDITSDFRNAEKILKVFARMGEEGSASQAEIKVRNNLQKSVAKRLQTLSMSFRSTQNEYLNRLKEQKKLGQGNQAFDFLNSSSTASSGSKGGGMGHQEIDNGFTSAQMQLVDDTEALVNQRDQEIANIAKSIEELAQIFRELAVLVIDQGTILDRIDYNMETAVEHAKEGINQLNQAEEQQKQNLPFKCMVVLSILIAIMLGILIWKHSPKK